jgi:sec-independent protein translocase protein TatA
MGSFSIWHWLIVLAVVLLFFGAGRLPSVMGDLAKCIKSFKAGMRDDEAEEKPETPKAITRDDGPNPALHAGDRAGTVSPRDENLRG